MKTIIDLLLSKISVSQLVNLLQQYGGKAFQFAFKLIQIWLCVFVLLIGYVIYSTLKWQENVVKIENYELELIQKQAKIDSILAYRNYVFQENQKLRNTINEIENKIQTLQSKFIKDITNDQKNTNIAVADTDDEALGKFAKRHGKGSVRYHKIRINLDSNHTSNQSK